MAKKYKWLDRRIAKPGPYLTLCLTAEELKDAAKGLTEWPLEFPMWGARAHMFQKVNGDRNVAIIALAKDSQENHNSVEIAGMLVHEAVHVWQPGDEQEAYAVQAIAQELMSEYARRIMNGTAPQPKEFILG
jgi:hypothetical protein